MSEMIVHDSQRGSQTPCENADRIGSKGGEGGEAVWGMS